MSAFPAIKHPVWDALEALVRGLNGAEEVGLGYRDVLDLSKPEAEAFVSALLGLSPEERAAILGGVFAAEVGSKRSRRKA